MSITQGTFLGATIVRFTINGNWNEQTANLNVTLVEDPVNGDDFLLKEENVDNLNGQMIGRPFNFTYEGFSLDGILQSYDKSVSVDGDPIYTVVLTTPVAILDSAQVILDGYIGPGNNSVFHGTTQSSFDVQVSNFLNVYGYAEGGGTNFGRSLTTQTGMYWNGTYGVKNILEILTNTIPPDGSVSSAYEYFGSYLVYKNQYYKLDLSGLPIPPDYYTIGGVVNMSLLELISRFCQDAGVDYLIQLTLGDNNGPHTISFKTVDRILQPQLGQISSYISSLTDVSTYSHGQELRPDITQAMLVGGSVNFLQPMSNTDTNVTIAPFWGFDFAGNPILGVKPDGTAYADDDHQMNLNAEKIADIMGELGYNLSYPCSILEIRCALANYDMWAFYIRKYKPTLASKLGLYGAFSENTSPETLFDLLTDDKGFADQLSDALIGDHWPAVAQKFYEFVREQGETYYGRKFIVQVPFNLQLKIVPQTFQVLFSDEIADAGYMPENSQILGLDYIHENYFLDDTGRFYPFVRFAGVNTFNSISGQRNAVANLGYLSSSSAVVQYSQNLNDLKIFFRCEQGEDGPVLQDGMLSGGAQIVFVPNNAGIAVPAIIITIPNPIFAQAEDVTGNINDLATVIGLSTAQLLDILSIRTSSFNLFIHPPALYPNGAAVAMKSNQYVYGPWGSFKTNGKLEFEQDDGLTPWDCGGYDTMNQIANAKLATIAMGNQVLERGNIVRAGVPNSSIGDVLFVGGPIINAVDCEISTNGVTTTYTLETFVNRIGAFSRENADRLKRIGKIYQQLRRSIRQLVIEKAQKSTIMQANYAGFLYGTTYSLQDHTPHAVLGGSIIYSTGTQSYVPNVFTQTYQESIRNVQSNNSGVFQKSACMGFEGLLRPFTNNINNTNLPWYFAPQGAHSGPINSTTLNPFQTGCDMNWILTGNTYTKMNHRLYPSQIDLGNLRGIALRGPMILNGWGYDIQGKPIPNAGATGVAAGIIHNLQKYNDSFETNYLTQSLDWHVGPIDLRWNKFSSTWCSPGMVLVGTISGQPLNPGGHSYLRLMQSNVDLDDYIDVYNHFIGTNASVATGVRVTACYNPMENRWYVMGADCVTS